ncbi:MAG: thermonuclease family protein [Pseudomonadota bacterium]
MVTALLVAASMSYGQALAQAFEKISNDRLLAPAPIEQQIEVVDGDTIWIGIHQIRLHGVDALEPKQECIRAGSPKSYCHLSASELLRTYTSRSDFRCEIHTKDGEGKPWTLYGRYVASCYAGETDVNLELVRRGWAYADRRYGESFITAQESAIEEGLGIHATEHLTPWEWRARQRSDNCSCD